MIDSRDIRDLHPCLQRGCRELIKRLEVKGYPVGISSTYRDNECQQELYNRHDGTTNAKGGESWHNYRLAFDLFKNISGHAFDDMAFFNTAGLTWMDMGGEWGHIVNFAGDNPHMQFTGGLTIKQLQNGLRLPETAKMKWENEKKGDHEVRYNSVKEIPIWAQPTVQKLIDKGYLTGDGNGLNLSEDMIRVFVINDKAGLYK